MMKGRNKPLKNAQFSFYYEPQNNLHNILIVDQHKPQKNLYPTALKHDSGTSSFSRNFHNLEHNHAL